MIRRLNVQKYCGWCASPVSYQSEWMSECPSCGYKRYFNPKPCSNILIVRENSVLLLKRSIEPQLGKFDLPGGFLEISDNSMEDGVFREMYEETGIDRDQVEPLEYLGSLKSPDYIWQGTAIKNISFFYIARLNDPDTPINLDLSENSETRWITEPDLPKIDFAWDIDKQMLTKYFRGKS